MSARTFSSSLLVLFALADAGCFGSSPAARFYTLSTLSPREGQGGGGGGHGVRVRVAPVTVPEGVDRPQMVRRTGENTVVVDEYDRWVEPLDALLRHTLVLDLGALLPEAQVLGDAIPGLAADRTVVVAMNRLELSGQLVMDAVWFVLPAGADQPERTHRTRLTEPAGSGGPADLAPALSRAMEKLSREIAAELAPTEKPR
ncbi:MAG TPA: PqiC family protein [Myxococcaceae bacterium]|nr:PqiC family protein [Myxococcaceae bacterium]